MFLSLYARISKMKPLISPFIVAFLFLCELNTALHNSVFVQVLPEQLTQPHLLKHSFNIGYLSRRI